MADTNIQTALPPAPRIPTGQEVFDALMGHIEPDLTTEGAKAAATKYAGESPEQKEARRKRYTLAFERYEQAYEGYMGTLHAQVQKFKRESFDRVETDDRARENGLLSGISNAILKLA